MMSWASSSLIVILVALTIFVYIAFQQKSSQAKTLAQRVEELSKEIESSKGCASTTSIQEAYLQFIYNLSHEVSNPLQSVQANLENMADCSPQEVGRWKQYYAIIQNEMRRLSNLTENLRLLSHLESATNPVKRESVNLKSVIEDVIMAQAEWAETKNIRLNYQGPTRPARVLGNRDLLHEVIHNLVDNSIKYAKDSGGEIVLGLSEDKSFMHVMVRDNGLGIPEEDLPYIFDTAFRSSNKLTVHRKGSGLGLAIVKRIVDQHEAKIRAESVFGQGTTIAIDLPLYSPEAAAVELIRP
jgi:two-component system, OmpR family, phosphate regulon sensor histidine kinase PhoR